MQGIKRNNEGTLEISRSYQFDGNFHFSWKLSSYRELDLQIELL